MMQQRFAVNYKLYSAQRGSCSPAAPQERSDVLNNNDINRVYVAVADTESIQAVILKQQLRRRDFMVIVT